MRHMAAEPDNFLSVQEASAEFHVGCTTIFKYIREGKLQRYGRAMDRRTLLDRQELKDLLEPIKKEPRARKER